MGRRTLAVACLLLLVAACSSTNKEAEPLATEVGATGASDPSTSSGPPATDAAGRPVATGVTSGGAPPGATGGGRGPTAVGGPKLKGGPPVRVGLHYTADLGGILGAVGAVDSTDGPGDEVAKKVTTWINANGGLGGRKLELVLHGGDALAGSFDAQAEEACVHFTQDDKVSYVISGAAGTTRTLLECLRKRNVPLIWNLHISIDQATFSKYDGYLYQPFSMKTERQGFYIDWLLGDGWAPKSAKVGVVLVDDPLHFAYRDKVIKPRLKANGMKPPTEVVVPAAQGANDAGALYAAMANGILKFRQAGVTHVLFAPTGGAIPFIFLNEAANQNYEPRYGFNSLDIPAFIDLNAPDGQLDGAMAAGWLITSDVLTAQRPKNNARERLCLKISDNRSDIASRYCEGLFFLKALFDKGADNTPASIKATVPKLGTSYVSPWAFKTDFTSGRPDGASGARMLKWGGACECFSYYGPLRTVK